MLKLFSSSQRRKSSETAVVPAASVALGAAALLVSTSPKVVAIVKGTAEPAACLDLLRVMLQLGVTPNCCLSNFEYNDDVLLVRLCRSKVVVITMACAVVSASVDFAIYVVSLTDLRMRRLANEL